MSPISQPLTTLNALSPLDGRYQPKLDALRPYFSEYALIKHRAWVEVEWLKALSAEPALAGGSDWRFGGDKDFARASRRQSASGGKISARSSYGDKIAASKHCGNLRCRHFVSA